LSTEVTSVSRYDQLLLDAPAAVTVISQEQMRRSGLHDMPDILRLAPGMQVERYAAGTWLASSRSFPGYGDNKMQVLLDGRSIYSEDIGQVYWGSQDFTIEDLDRVEVIRGPGGTSPCNSPGRPLTATVWLPAAGRVYPHLKRIQGI